MTPARFRAASPRPPATADPAPTAFAPTPPTSDTPGIVLSLSPTVLPMSPMPAMIPLTIALPMFDAQPKNWPGSPPRNAASLLTTSTKVPGRVPMFAANWAMNVWTAAIPFARFVPN
jgi:hypothetical protein